MPGQLYYRNFGILMLYDEEQILKVSRFYIFRTWFDDIYISNFDHVTFPVYFK